MMNAVEVDGLSYSYVSRRHSSHRIVLDSVSLNISEAEVFGLLGPNGSGKTTLFRILATLVKPAAGRVKIFGADIVTEPSRARTFFGVTFQHPSLDRKLTVRENLMYHGHLYGLRGTPLKRAIQEALSRYGIADRSNDLVEHLSGGLQRRVELAKGLLPQPRLLLLDEPSTGLDPGARREFGDLIAGLRDGTGLTVVLATHILEDAERCDRVGILDAGRLVTLGTPAELKQEIGGDVVSVATREPQVLCGMIQDRFGGQPTVVNGTVRIARKRGHEFIPQLVEAFPGRIDSVTVSKPTLEDVFIRKTGHGFSDGAVEAGP